MMIKEMKSFDDLRAALMIPEGGSFFEHATAAMKQGRFKMDYFKKAKAHFEALLASHKMIVWEAVDLRGHLHLLDEVIAGEKSW